MRVKDQILMGKQSNVVYQIPCSCGKVYIGETIRRLQSRVKEHQDACRKYQTEKSAIAEHAWGMYHVILWEVLDSARINLP
jgi:predicted GIY-YIG superfamily endonuclease